MTSKQKLAIGAGVAVGIGIVVSVFFIIRHRPRPSPPVPLTGVVLAQDTDPRKQLPIANAQVTAVMGAARAATVSDASGLFRLILHPHEQTPRAISLRFSSAGFEPLELTTDTADRIYVVRLTPLPRPAPPAAKNPESVISNLRVRYSEKAAITTDIGSLVKTFEVKNVGNIPCADRPPCSPDGKWKASIGSFTVDGEGEQFNRVRLSCIAGPCPLTKIESEKLIDNDTKLQLSIRNWSETATFLLEAEVSRNVITDVIRQSIPAIFGPSMSFTLPAAGAGPSIEAEINGRDIVFPLGPALRLSWAECSVKIAADRTKLYRCDLKRGYRFR